MNNVLLINMMTRKALELFDPTLPLPPGYMEPMTDTDRLAETAAEEAELRAKFGDAAEEILRLRARDLAAFDEIRHLRARIAELEAINSMIVGTVRAGIVGELDEPATITHDIPPNAPR